MSLPTRALRMLTAPVLLVSFFSIVWPAGAAAGALHLDRQHPPVLVSPTVAEFPSAAGHTRLEVLPAVVVHSESTKRPHPRARSLGGRSWKIDAPDAATAIEWSLSLSTRPGIDTVFPDVVLTPVPFAGDPYREGQWYLDSLDFDTLHAVSLGDASVRVAVIDSAIDHEHADLVDRVDAPYDALDDDFDPAPVPGDYCSGSSTAICDTHGTAVAGVVAATADNGVGIRGMCPACTLIPIRMLGDSGGSLSVSVAAFEHAIAQDASVINNSWGYAGRVPAPAPLAAVIARAYTEPRDGLGAVVVFAAGNDNRGIGDEEVCALPGVICVSAVDNYGYPTSYTNFGAAIDVAAPSATVSISPVDDYTTDFGGTSAAAPVVSGLAAWILAVAPDHSAAEVAELLITTAAESPFVTHGEDGHHDTYGHGIIDPPAILARLQNPGTTDSIPDSGVPPDSEAPVSDDGSPKSRSGCSTSSSASAGTFWLVAALLCIVRRRMPASRPPARYPVQARSMDTSIDGSPSRCGQWLRIRAHSRGSGQYDQEVG